MNLAELLTTTPQLQIQLPCYKDANSILNIVMRAVELNHYYIKGGCDLCTDGKFRTDSESYPGYTTRDCECMIQNNYINDSLHHLKNINKREILKYNYNKYIKIGFSKESLYTLLDKKKKWHFLFGEPGTGKTYAAYVLLYMYSLKNTVFATSLQAVLEDARPSKINEIQGLLYKKCEQVEVLLLDDIGREKLSEWVQNKLFELLNIRDKRNLTTIFTSNTSLEDLNIFSDKAIKSRFLGNCNKLTFVGKDLRIW